MCDTENVETKLSKHVVHLENVGPVNVYVQGDLDKDKGGESVFLTLHGVGGSHQDWVNFFNHEDMRETRDRSLVVHVSLPGQQKGAEDLDQFPSMASLGMSLVTVLDQLRISRVVVLGEAAGANIAVRFAANHPGRVSGLVVANLKHATASFPAKLKSMKGGKFLDTDLNLQNVAKYEAAYKARDEILNLIGSSLTVDSLFICGANNSACARAAEEILTVVPVGLCSILKVENVDRVLTEAGDKLADSLILFCQGLGLVPSVQRKVSRSRSIIAESNPEEESEAGDQQMAMKTRKISMEMFDIPNIRRLSLSHNV